MKSVILGIDQATHTGYAVLDSDGMLVESGTVAFSSKVGVRLAEFEKWFTTMLIKYAPVMVVYEKPHFRGYDSTVSCVGLVAEMLKCSTATGTPLIGVHSATLKAYATGSGKASKEEMTDAASIVVGKQLDADKNNDEADAIHLSRYGWDVLTKETRCNRKKS